MRVSAWLVRDGKTRTRQAHDVGGDCGHGVVRLGLRTGESEEVRVKSEKVADWFRLLSRMARGASVGGAAVI